MKYKYIFFDLDGTLWDSREGITKGVQYALSKMGIEEPDLKKLERKKYLDTLDKKING